MTLAKLIKAATLEIESAEARIATFAEKMVKDPAYALAWGGDSFAAAARLKVWRSIANYLADQALTGDELVVENVKKEAMNNVMRGARYPEHSTSPCSNLMTQEVTSAWADVLEALNR